MVSALGEFMYCILASIPCVIGVYGEAAFVFFFATAHVCAFFPALPPSLSRIVAADCYSVVSVASSAFSAFPADTLAVEQEGMMIGVGPPSSGEVIWSSHKHWHQSHLCNAVRFC